MQHLSAGSFDVYLYDNTFCCKNSLMSGFVTYPERSDSSITRSKRIRSLLILKCAGVGISSIAIIRSSLKEDGNNTVSDKDILRVLRALSFFYGNVNAELYSKNVLLFVLYTRTE